MKNINKLFAIPVVLLVGMGLVTPSLADITNPAEVNQIKSEVKDVFAQMGSEHNRVMLHGTLEQRAISTQGKAEALALMKQVNASKTLTDAQMEKLVNFRAAASGFFKSVQ